MKVAWTARRHAMAWLILSAFAITYLMTLAIFPPDSRRADDNDRFATAQQGKIGTGRELTGAQAISLRAELTALRRQVQESTLREKQLRDRIALIERAFGPSTGSLPPQSEEAEITGSLREQKSDAHYLPKITVTSMPLPEDGFGDTGLEVSPLPLARTATAMRTRFGVELATAASAADLKKAWTKLGSSHKNLLADLEIRQYAAETPADAETAPELKLIAGPFTNAAGAARLCARLRAAGADCKETVFLGEAL